MSDSEHEVVWNAAEGRNIGLDGSHRCEKILSFESDKIVYEYDKCIPLGRTGDHLWIEEADNKVLGRAVRGGLIYLNMFRAFF
jgi:hypothetical protein